MSKIKRLLFDIDGTLISGVSFQTAICQTLKNFHLYSSYHYSQMKKALETYEDYYTSYTSKQYISHINKHLGLQTRLSDTFLECFFENLKMVVPPIGESNKIREMIEKLYKAKYELILVSNYFEISQRNRLRTMGINDYFSDYYGEKLIKPHSQVFLDAIGDCKPEECVMIGDNLKLDIAPAISNGISTIFINSRNTPVRNNDILQINSILEVSEELLYEYSKRKKETR